MVVHEHEIAFGITDT